MFGERLAQLRTERGLSQAELSRRARVSQPHISQLESSERQPGIDVCYRLAVGLGCKLSDLVPDTAPTAPTPPAPLEIAV